MDRTFEAHNTPTGWSVNEYKQGELQRVILITDDRCMAQAIAQSYQNGYEIGLADGIRAAILFLKQ